MPHLATMLVLALAASAANAEDTPRSGRLFDELAESDHDRDGAMTGRQATGRHTFTREGEEGSEIAQFVHLWRYSDGQWRLARVLSFDHRPLQP